MYDRSKESEISKFINAYKISKQQTYKKEYPEIKKHLWKDMFQSYCLISTGGVMILLRNIFKRARKVKLCIAIFYPNDEQKVM